MTTTRHFFGTVDADARTTERHADDSLFMRIRDVSHLSATFGFYRDRVEDRAALRLHHGGEDTPIFNLPIEVLACIALLNHLRRGWQRDVKRFDSGGIGSLTTEEKRWVGQHPEVVSEEWAAMLTVRQAGDRLHAALALLAREPRALALLAIDDVMLGGDSLGDGVLDLLVAVGNAMNLANPIHELATPPGYDDDRLGGLRRDCHIACSRLRQLRDALAE